MLEFNNISKTELNKIEEMFNNLVDVKTKNFSEDIGCQKALEEFKNFILKYSEEDFVQIIIDHADYELFNWALGYLKNKKIKKAAIERMREVLQPEYDDSEIEEILGTS